MPALPKCLRRPHPWLAMFAFAVVVVLADSFRPPGSQWTGRAYQATVKGYQWAKPRCGLEARCRFSPSCSHYSSAAVERYGIWRGLAMSFDRIRRCQPDVPAGTCDPVPEDAGELHSTKLSGNEKK